MKRFLIIMLSIMLLMCVSSCSSKSRIEKLDDNDPLLTADGKVLMTAGEFRQLMTEQELSKEYLGTETKKEKVLFIYQAELALLSYFAEQHGIEYDKSLLEEEYDAHLYEIQDETAYPGQLAFYTALKKEFRMTASEMKEWSVSQSYKDYNMKQLIADIAEIYGNITDGSIMKEYIQSNLLFMTEEADLTIGYPGVASTDFTYNEILEMN